MKIIDDLYKKIKLNYGKITYIFYMITIVLYEFLYCNGDIFVTNKYNFSLARIVSYLLFFFLLFKLRKRIFKENKSFNHKIKKVCIISYIPLSIVSLIIFYFIYKIYGIQTASIGLITMLLSGVFLLNVSENYIKNIVIVTFTLGMVFSITTEFNHRLDERKHFMSAFNVSMGNLNYKNDYVCDEQILKIEQLEKFILSKDKLEGIYKPQISKNIELDPSTAPAGNSFILYVPSALGMLFSRILRGSLLDMYITGRIFNLITYMFLIIIALKILPFKKNIFYIIFNLPLILLLGASYSIDALSLGIISIFIAYCLKLNAQNERITIKQIIILILYATFLIIAKSMAYIAVGLIILILPIKKILEENKKYIPLFITIFAIGIIIGTILISRINIESDVRSEDTNSSKQIEYILKNPISLIPIFYRHIRDTLLDFAWLTELNTEMFFYSFSNCTFILLFVGTLLISLNDESKSFSLKDRIILMGTFLVVYIMTSIALYIGFTEVGGPIIKGYQARYIIPILPLLLSCFNNRLIKININGNIEMLISIAWGVITIIDLIGLIAV